MSPGDAKTSFFANLASRLTIFDCDDSSWKIFENLKFFKFSKFQFFFLIFQKNISDHAVKSSDLFENHFRPL